MTKQQFKEYINAFDFTNLFNHLGWAYIKENTPVKIDTETYTLQSIAEKSGYRILVCEPGAKGAIPEYSTRLKIHNNISRLFKEHLIIFTDKKNTQQVWQTVQKEISKPAKFSTVNWTKGQEPELLFQKTGGLIFTLAEEDNITIADVTKRVADNFSQNNEKVTKQFYDRFKQQHTAFLKFIKGIEDKVNQEWYASLMLNRLMFCYFIQKKGFLDNNKNYLTDKLKECRNKKGKNKFYSFYRNFLLQLFHKGLGAPDHSKELTNEIGNIPYLNGGLFDTHEIEKDYKDKIEIDDKAFESIFKFFDEWEWHLDTRHTASGKDVNPDVIGYIFEKYINDRADMGAYYTKEDITDYISKNCIIPFLFDETKRQQPKAFNADSEIWKAVKDNSDKYIYDAVKHGINSPSPLGEPVPAFREGLGVRSLPEEIAAGIKDVSKRTEWNKPAPAEFALPTEIWREVVERRQRYEDVKKKIETGEVNNINDFITYNLNIRQFAIDTIANTNDPEFLKAFYKSLNNVTIIDPTCGSGAFLFAAMNILEELYEQCIQRMRAFAEDEDRTNAGEKKLFSHKFKFFREVLENLQSLQHPNLQYFIYKNIILQNLYGVDIMKEAVEIAKLRLFLKLVATVDADYSKPNFGLEPLPDIDFNIRAGNTLIGFATEEELKNGLRYSLDGVAAAPVIEEKCDVVAKAYTRYKQIQLSYGDDYKEFKIAKDELNKRLKELNYELNLLLHKQAEGLKYEKWLKSYQPFHWFAEFYEIVNGNKGFDVVIGNPPYVELKDVKTYSLKNYQTLKCGNLYANCFERAIQLGNQNTFIGFIIPVASVCTDGYSSLQKLWINNGSVFISCYNDRPGKLFEGLEHIRLSIVILKKQIKNNQVLATKYYKWNTIAREFLFENLNYNDVTALKMNTLIPKLNTELGGSVLSKIQLNKKKTSSYILQSSSHNIFFTRKLSGFVQILNFIPKIIDAAGNVRNPSELKELRFGNKEQSETYLSVLNSSLFYWYLTVWSDCRNLNQRELQNFNFDFSLADKKNIKFLTLLSSRLMLDIQTHSVMLPMNFKNVGQLNIQCIYPKYSKPIIDQIDTALAAHYDFTDEELDFIINYDIKYRMGKELESEDV